VRFMSRGTRRQAHRAVKLIIVENLSRRLVARLADLFPGSIHVTDVALEESPDASIWEYAKANGCTILTADADFFELATDFGLDT
jgi:predicted nuclease of predicted toxin-antitoxin system